MMKNKPNISGIGVDLAKIARFENQAALARKILSEKELSQYQTHPQPAQFLAGRFAAKEAFIKAYRGPHFPNLSTIEVLSDTDGAPFIIFNHQQFHVSISHDGEYAVAMVII